MVNRIQNESGFALAMVLVLGILVSITAAIALNTSGFRLRMTQRDENRMGAFYLDEAVVRLALQKLGAGIPPFDSPATWTDGADAPFVDDSLPERIEQVDITRPDGTTSQVHLRVSWRSPATFNGQFVIQAKTEM